MKDNVLFQPPSIVNPAELETIRKQQQPHEVDIYQRQLEELYRINNPSASADEYSQQNEEGHHVSGIWIYYPWRNTLLHCVDEDALFTLRTNRNRELISIAQQKQLANAIVGVAGMSVGAGIAVAMAYSGIAQHIKLADFDTLDTSNLNRLRESLLDVGRPKIELAAERIYEINPFARPDMFGEGLTDANIGSFFDDPKLSIVIDEIDDFKMKVHLRLRARDLRIPLIMFTSLGDNILVDVERYDRQPDAPLFNGLLGNIDEEILSKDQLSPDDIKKYSIKLVGQQYIPTAALRSVLEIGHSLVGRPQLYSTIAVDGGLATYVVRRLILNETMPSGRYFIQFAQLFNLASTDLDESADRTDALNRIFNGS